MTRAEQQERYETWMRWIEKEKAALKIFEEYVQEMKPCS